MSDFGTRKRPDSWGESPGTTAPRTKRVRLEDRESSTHPTADEPQPRLRYEDYTVGWICALPLELAAAQSMLDDFHPALDQKQGDSNAYTLGSIASHNIVMACLPKGSVGTNSAAVVAAHMVGSFPSIDKRLMVGIGGGAPGSTDIRLGDVVVGDQVVQYDLGKAVPNHFQRTAIPTRPPPAMLTAVSKLHASHAWGSSKIPQIIDDMLSRHPAMSRFKRPQVPDLLFEDTYNHTSSTSACSTCDEYRLVRRSQRLNLHPDIHYGKIASGNTVIKDGMTRRDLTQGLEAICFEMEAAGLGDNFPCLVIRGICDYSDSHKNKQWQEYAAATAAAYAKELLLDIPASESKEEPIPIQSLRESGPVHTPANSLKTRKRRQILLNSLSFNEIESRHQSIKDALRRTCEWFIHDSRYLDWLDPDKFSQHSGLLWIGGKPGAGKSTIMKFTYVHLSEKWESFSDHIVISFFFNARGAQLEKSTKGMYRSLLYQLLRLSPHLHPLLDQYESKLFAEEENEDNPSIPWTVLILEDLFRRVIKNLGENRLVCFIDALDEGSEDQIRDMVDFFEELGGTAFKHRTIFSVCFASRHYPHIELQRGGLRLTLEEQPGHSDDVERYVRNKLRIGPGKVAREMHDLLLQKASGVFMWVVLVVNILNKELQHGRIAEAKRLLEELPPKLSDLFKNMLIRDTNNLSQLLLCLQWILFAKYPLTCSELYFAIQAGSTNDDAFPYEWDAEYETLELMNRFILSTSKGLAEVSGKKQTVQFIHESVRDFLIKDDGIREIWPEHSTHFETFSHGCLATCCLTYTRLSLSSSWHFRDYIEELPADSFFMSEKAEDLRSTLSLKYPFLCYATTNLLKHANARRPYENREIFPGGTTINMKRWICLDNLYQKLDSGRHSFGTPVPEIFAERDHVELLKEYYFVRRTEVWPNGIRDENHGSHPVFAAIYEGHEAACRFLLEEIIHDVNLENMMGETMLIAAVECGHDHLVKYLLSQNLVDINARDRAGNSALIVAIDQGHYSITKRLLSRNEIDLESTDRDGRTAQWVAASEGNWPVVGQFLRKGLIYNVNETYNGRTLLSFAAASGALEILDLLLSFKDVDHDLRDKDGRTPLMWAVEEKQVGSVQRLVAAGADVNLCERLPPLFSPLIVAMRWSFHEAQELEILRELLKAPDLDVNYRVGGRTALSYAAERGGSKDGIRMLLWTVGVDVNLPDENGNSPLIWAAMKARVTATEELLKMPGLDVASRNHEGKTALDVAVEKKYGRVEDLLRKAEGVGSTTSWKDLVFH